MNPKELLEKLPLVRGWIDRTLAERSNGAQPVASYRFSLLDFICWSTGWIMRASAGRPGIGTTHQSGVFEKVRVSWF